MSRSSSFGSLWNSSFSSLFTILFLQRRNLRILYDAIGTLADAVGADLNEVPSVLCGVFTGVTVG